MARLGEQARAVGNGFVVQRENQIGACHAVRRLGSDRRFPIGQRARKVALVVAHDAAIEDGVGMRRIGGDRAL